MRKEIGQIGGREDSVIILMDKEMREERYIFIYYMKIEDAIDSDYYLLIDFTEGK